MKLQKVQWTWLRSAAWACAKRQCRRNNRACRFPPGPPSGWNMRTCGTALETLALRRLRQLSEDLRRVQRVHRRPVFDPICRNCPTSCGLHEVSSGYSSPLTGFSRLALIARWAQMRERSIEPSPTRAGAAVHFHALPWHRPGDRSCPGRTGACRCRSPRTPRIAQGKSRARSRHRHGSCSCDG